MMLLVYSSSIQRQETDMNFERTLRNLGFAIASFAIVAAFGFTVEFQPVINALAR
jgi:hypothetical protein